MAIYDYNGDKKPVSYTTNASDIDLDDLLSPKKPNKRRHRGGRGKSNKTNTKINSSESKSKNSSTNKVTDYHNYTALDTKMATVQSRYAEKSDIDDKIEKLTNTLKIDSMLNSPHYFRIALMRDDSSLEIAINEAMLKLQNTIKSNISKWAKFLQDNIFYLICDAMDTVIDQLCFTKEPIAGSKIMVDSDYINANRVSPITGTATEAKQKAVKAMSQMYIDNYCYVDDSHSFVCLKFRPGIGYRPSVHVDMTNLCIVPKLSFYVNTKTTFFRHKTKITGINIICEYMEIKELDPTKFNIIG